MTALAMDVRELSFAEIDMVSGGGWFSDLASAIGHFVGQLVDAVVDAAEWFFQHFTVTYNDKDDSVIITSK